MRSTPQLAIDVPLRKEGSYLSATTAPLGPSAYKADDLYQNNEKGGRPESASPETGRQIVRLLYAYEP